MGRRVSRWSDEYHDGQGGHNGIDIGVGLGNAVYAASNGTIVAAESSGARGNVIVIEHKIGNTGYSYYSYYQHLQSFEKTSGDVNAGDIIAYSGNSGGSEAHLHFGIVRGTSGRSGVYSCLSELEGLGWALTEDQQSGRILVNPSLDSPCGFPTADPAVVPPLKAHPGSVKYTFNASEATVWSRKTPDMPTFVNLQSNYPTSSGGQTTITFQWSDVGAEQYYLHFATLQDNGSYKYWEDPLGYSGTQSAGLLFNEGWYYVELTAVNSAGPSPVNSAYFSVGNTAPEASAAVPVNQTEYNGHVYERYDYHMSWTEAKAYCEELGGYLAVLTSKEEENAVKSQLTGRRNAMYYLGFTDPSQSGNWQTVTGEAFTYSNWAANEPTKGAGEYYAALMARSYEGNGSEGYWIDNPDKELWGFYQYANAGFICEYDQKCTHDWDSGEITTAPTCTTGGEKTFTCNLCGETYTESVTALGHDYAETVIAGTCTQRPGTKYDCSRCGDSYTVWDEGGWSEWSTEYPSDYAEDDIEIKVQYRYRDKETTTSSSSTLDGWTPSGSETVWSEYGEWSSWSTDYAAESDTTQVETRTGYYYYYFQCSNCGAHMHGTGTCYSWAGGCGQSTVSSGSFYSARYDTPYSSSSDWYGTGVNYIDSSDGKVFAYTSTSSQHYVAPATQYRYRTRTQSTVYSFYRWGEWSVWSDTEVDGTDTREVEMRGMYRYDLYANGQHSWDDGAITIQPTCTAEGEKTFTCSTCGEPRTEPVSATGHTVVKDPAVSATCTTAGKTEGSHCSVCNEVLTAQTTIPATGHTAVTDPAVAATCTTAGKTEGSHCSVCNEVLTAQTTIPATGHTEVTDSAVAATCTTAGKTEGSHCSVCNAVLVAQDTVPATGHSFGEWSETKAPTLTEDGEESRSCQNTGCTETETRAVQAVIYTISYDANGGSGAPEAQQKLKGNALTLSTTKPIYSGYTFKGWATSKTAATADYAPGASYTTDESVTLYAVWEEDVVVDENAPAIEVSTVNVRPGEEVDVTISLKNNPGIAGMTLNFEYDDTVMTLVSITESNLEGMWQKVTGVTWASSTGDSTYNGVFLTLKFAVNADAAEGDYQVKVLYNAGDICNNDLEDVDFVSVPGTVIVRNRVIGDVSGDGVVNTKDFITLMRILAGADLYYVPNSMDINGDGAVNTKDFITLMKYLAGADIEIH